MKRFDLMFGVNVRGTYLLLAGLHSVPEEGARTRTSSPSRRR